MSTPPDEKYSSSFNNEGTDNIAMGLYPHSNETKAITSQHDAKTLVGDLGYNMAQAHEIIPGLEYLNAIDQLIVQQKVELLEVLCGCETKNKYYITNSMGQFVYLAAEETDCCTRNCCGPSRPFDIHILDYTENKVMHLYRDLRCSSCCCPCCLQRLEVYAPPGNFLGTVVQEWSICRPNLSVQTVEGETIFNITGPLCVASCSDIKFKVYDANEGNHIGNITKQWSGLIRESLTDADHFSITFPLQLEVKKKALLLGALFLIDFMYFEHTQK